MRRLFVASLLGTVALAGDASAQTDRVDLLQREPAIGEMKVGTTVVVGYADQHSTTLDPDITVRKLVAGPHREPDHEDKALLEKFWFDGTAQYAPVRMLSGGEKRRLQLVMVLARQPNLLILDEPTNDLDLDTLRRLGGISVPDRKPALSRHPEELRVARGLRGEMNVEERPARGRAAMSSGPEVVVGTPRLTLEVVDDHPGELLDLEADSELRRFGQLAGPREGRIQTIDGVEAEIARRGTAQSSQRGDEPDEHVTESSPPSRSIRSCSAYRE